MKLKIFLLILLPILTLNLAFSAVTKEDLALASEAILKAYDEELRALGTTVKINPAPAPTMPDYWWEIDGIHASYVGSMQDEVQHHLLFLFGGYARQDYMTRDGTALTLCHEMGHGFGGPPYKIKSTDYIVSVEAQSDYYSTNTCLKKVFNYLEPEFPVEPVSAYVKDLCLDKYSTPEDINFCYRAFQALEVERSFLLLQYPYKEVFYDVKDPSVVDEVNLNETFYPRSQCRLDTMVAGVLNEDRPKCWFHE